MITLEVDGVCARGDFALDVAFEAGPGEVLGVLGPNGSGKSTLLRLLAGLEALTTGRIRLGERTIDDPVARLFTPAQQRPVGMVFQEHRLMPHLSVRDNVLLGRRWRVPGARGSRRRRGDPAWTAAWLARFELTELADRRPDQLSGGQAQRVALARALAAGADLLLLDEPLAAMDAASRLHLRTQLRGLVADFPGPVLMVTHDPIEALALTDRLLVLDGGRVAQLGTPAEVARRPATAHVAHLVGLNLYAGRLAESAPADLLGAREVRLDDGGTLVGTPVEQSLSPGDPVLVTMRPEAITVHARHPEAVSTRNLWPGAVAGMEMIQGRVRLQVDGAPAALVDVTPAAVAELRLRPGERIWLAAKAVEVEVYAAER